MKSDEQGDIILNILRDQFSSVIIELLENLKNTLYALYIC
jgi:hypothetical protein